MDYEEMREFLERSAVADIRSRFEADLDLPSPRIGATGPTDPGPDEPLIEAIANATADARERTGTAICQILLSQLLEAGGSDSIPKPFLAFNLMVVLSGVSLPNARPALVALKEMKAVLQGALSERNEDMYRWVLLALVENQGEQGEVDFWKWLLGEDREPEYYGIATAGLRRGRWETACEALPLVKKAFERHPDSGDIDTAVMLLIDGHPDANWPTCAAEFLSISEHPGLGELIERYSQDRYNQPLTEVTPHPGSALADLVSRREPSELAEIDREMERTPVQPNRALTAVA